MSKIKTLNKWKIFSFIFDYILSWDLYSYDDKKKQIKKLLGTYLYTFPEVYNRV